MKLKDEVKNTPANALDVLVPVVKSSLTMIGIMGIAKSIMPIANTLDRLQSGKKPNLKYLGREVKDNTLNKSTVKLGLGYGAAANLYYTGKSLIKNKDVSMLRGTLTKSINKGIAEITRLQQRIDKAEQGIEKI